MANHNFYQQKRKKRLISILQKNPRKTTTFLVSQGIKVHFCAGMYDTAPTFSLLSLFPYGNK